MPIDGPNVQVSVPSLLEAAGLFGCFVTLLFAGSRFIPRRAITGGTGPPGARPVYVLNGLTLFSLVIALAGGGQFLGAWSLAGLLEYIVEFFIVANVFAFAASFLLFAMGRQRRGQRQQGATWTHVWQDVVLGVEANPTWLGVDLKMFSYRPSLIGLCLINIAFAVAQYQHHGTVSTAMLLYQAFTFLYVFNYFQFEYGMRFTWDVIAEKFGWMLVWGDYVVVPFFYSLPGWFLIDRLDPMPVASALGLIALFAGGLILFRGANEQKHRFKLDPQTRIWGKPAKTLEGRLLASGFWGIGRHLNYSGEICIYLAFTLTTGFATWIPYVLPTWLMALLVHRAWRDDRRCQAKYGPLWEQYKRRAKFRMVPFIY